MSIEIVNDIADDDPARYDQMLAHAVEKLHHAKAWVLVMATEVDSDEDGGPITMMSGRVPKGPNLLIFQLQARAVIEDEIRRHAYNIALSKIEEMSLPEDIKENIRKQILEDLADLQEGGE